MGNPSKHVLSRVERGAERNAFLDGPSGAATYTSLQCPSVDESFCECHLRPSPSTWYGRSIVTSADYTRVRLIGTGLPVAMVVVVVCVVEAFAP